MSRRKSIAMAALLVFSLVSFAAIGGSGALAQEEERGADLYILQPTYIDGSVGENRSGQTPVYETRGEVLRITPQNFDAEDVVGYGLETTEGEIEFDERSNQYVLYPEADGTYRAFWIAEEERLVEREVEGDDGNVTTVEEPETFRVKYVAVVQTEGTDYAHVSAERWDETRLHAENWDNLVDEIQSSHVAGPDADVETELESALAYLRLLNNPWAALTGEFTGILLSLFLTLGGLLVLALFGAYHIWVSRFEKSYVNRIESLEADRENIDERHDELMRESREKVLSNLDWQDLGFPDHVAAAFRQSFGETVLEGWMTLQEIMLPENIIRDRIEAMGKVGYNAAVVRDDDGSIIEARILPLNVPYSVGDDEEEIAITDASKDSTDFTYDDLVEAVDWSDEEMLAFNLPDANFDRDELSTVLDSKNVEELIEKVERQVGDGKPFDTREEYLEYIVEFAVDVRMHEFTTEHGAPKPVRYMLETWLKVAQITSDRYSFPFADYTVEDLQLILMNEDVGADVARYVNEVEAGKHG